MARLVWRDDDYVIWGGMGRVSVGLPSGKTTKASFAQSGIFKQALKEVKAAAISDEERADAFNALCRHFAESVMIMSSGLKRMSDPFKRRDGMIYGGSEFPAIAMHAATLRAERDR